MLHGCDMGDSWRTVLRDLGSAVTALKNLPCSEGHGHKRRERRVTEEAQQGYDCLTHCRAEMCLADR